MSNALRLTILMTDSPYPPHHGGRVDRWMRLKGLNLLGMHVQLVVWTESAGLPEAARGTLETVCTELLTVRRRRRLRAFLASYPPGRLDSFLPDTAEALHITNAVRRFDPGLVVADGLETSLFAQLISGQLSVPLVYRSQNVEHLYWHFQGRLAKGMQRLPFILAERGLEKSERQLRNSADLILDISEEDRSWWQGENHHERSTVLPPTWIAEPPPFHSEENMEIDVSFTGGLFAPNNVRGLEWYCMSVLPLVLRRIGNGVRCVFAGSSPGSELKALCSANSIECIANPDSLSIIRSRSRVLINPVLHSSGVNVKMLEMLASGRPVVTTPAGARGLPPALRALVHVREDAVSFADAIVNAILDPMPSQIDLCTAVLNRECGVNRLADVIAMMRALVH